MLVYTTMKKLPYSVTFAADHPRRRAPNNTQDRWYWLHDNIGSMGQDWHWQVPFDTDEDLVFYFKTPEDRALFVLTWG